MASRPPSDITPQKFFEDWLPGQYAQLAEGIENPPPDITVNVDVTGDGGGQWTLSLAGGELTVASGQAPDAPIGFVQSVEHWHAVTTGKAEEELGLAISDDSFASVDKLLFHPALGRVAAAITTIQGTLDLEITNSGTPKLAARLVFQGATEPQAAISVTTETLSEIQSGQIAAPQAFFAGKIMITGEATLAMQLGMLLMQP